MHDRHYTLYTKLYTKQTQAVDDGRLPALASKPDDLISPVYMIWRHHAQQIRVQMLETFYT